MAVTQRKLDRSILNTKSVDFIRNLYDMVTIGGNKRRKWIKDHFNGTVKKSRKHNKDEWISKLLQCPIGTQSFAVAILNDSANLSNPSFLSSLNQHIDEQKQQNHKELTITSSSSTKSILCFGLCRMYEMEQVAICQLINNYMNWNKTVVILDFDDTLCPTSFYWKNQDILNSFIDAVMNAVEELLVVLSSFDVYIVTNAAKQWLDRIYHEYPRYKELFDKYTSMVISAHDLNVGEFGMETVSWKYHTVAGIVKARTDIERFISIGDSNVDSLMARDIMNDHKISNKSMAIKLKRDPSISDMIQQLVFIKELIQSDNYRMCYIYDFQRYSMDSIKTDQDLLKMYGMEAIETYECMWSNTNICSIMKGRTDDTKYLIKNLLRPDAFIKIDGNVYKMKKRVKNMDKRKKQKKETFNGIVQVINVQNNELEEIDLNDKKKVNCLLVHQSFIEYLRDLMLSCGFCGTGPFTRSIYKKNHVLDYHKALKL